MDQFELSNYDLFSDPDEQVRSIVSKLSEDDLSVATEREEISAIYNKLIARAKGIDASLEQSVKADKARALGQLDNLEKKLTKAAKKNNETVINQADKLFESIFPVGVFQERYESLFSQLIRYDIGVIDEMKECIDPFDPSLKILSASQG
jgi:uncharacterized protein YllA (UPF0747 family)